MLKTNRGFWKTFFLIIITLGIYGLYYIYSFSKEVNLTCTEVDKNKVGGLLFYIFMSIITMGLYSLYWNYKVCDKMATLVIQQGGQPRITGGGWLLWTILGSIILVGPFIAIAKQIHLWNDANEIYNKKQGQVNDINL